MGEALFSHEFFSGRNVRDDLSRIRTNPDEPDLRKFGIPMAFGVGCLDQASYHSAQVNLGVLGELVVRSDRPKVFFPSVKRFINGFERLADFFASRDTRGQFPVRKTIGRANL